MSSSDKRTTGTVDPTQTASSDLPAITGSGAPAMVGQFGPGAMPRRREPRVVYAVPCHAGFRGAVLALAKARGIAVAELVRMVLVLVAPESRAEIPDPGEPSRNDPDASVPCPRGDRLPRPSLVPTLVLRLAPGLDHATIRRALALALALDDPNRHRLIREEDHRRLTIAKEKLEHRNRALASAVERLAFRPRPNRLGLEDAAAVLGLSGNPDYDEQTLSKRFRELAPIFHPDTGVLPCRERMGQLIEARNLLVQHLRRSR